MPKDRLMNICLSCDYCRIKFDVRGIQESWDLDTKWNKIFNRDTLAQIRCQKGVITDKDGVPKSYSSQTALITAEDVDGTCPFYKNGDEE